ncbi:hypothetical protein [Burkholderia vietnamiensis]|uniref:hypothetical protein n=1 Tax=Burkholderia vietnamiensis TaxID=60552 RepID=UPI00075ACB9A|nr:hypothetical protein [Burkholderia vietnamiensis]KVE59930.1 hypothetical protein WI94_02745 [Burkholderia vietnamiensis]KVE84345.1 hypothetical protein WJ00_19880 [Burkholderia vietnamiensis]MDN7927389.1 hypothetical protein [Burkholderia vietnamiensis]HDR9251702.1 hypothetical protein [Burkholderia vietnamiensis]
MFFNWFRKKNEPVGPDYADIDSQAKAEALYKSGALGKLLLMPREFGGPDSGLNVVYVPADVIQIKQSMDRNIIAPLVQSGKVTRYEATPEYQGSSFIPTAIKVEASEPGQFSSTIKIWGEALRRQN